MGGEGIGDGKGMMRERAYVICVGLPAEGGGDGFEGFGH